MSARETHGNSASSSPSVFAKWQNFLRVGAWNHSWVQLWTSHEDAASENMVVVCFNIFNPFQGDEYNYITYRILQRVFVHQKKQKRIKWRSEICIDMHYQSTWAEGPAHPGRVSLFAKGACHQPKLRPQEKSLSPL